MCIAFAFELTTINFCAYRSTIRSHSTEYTIFQLVRNTRQNRENSRRELVQSLLHDEWETMKEDDRKWKEYDEENTNRKKTTNSNNNLESNRIRWQYKTPKCLCFQSERIQSSNIDTVAYRMERYAMAWQGNGNGWWKSVCVQQSRR